MRSLFETEVISAKEEGKISRREEVDVIRNMQHSERTSKLCYQKSSKR